jgi:hypothetical protein
MSPYIIINILIVIKIESGNGIKILFFLVKKFE